jgi:hypothetical protein
LPVAASVTNETSTGASSGAGTVTLSMLRSAAFAVMRSGSPAGVVSASAGPGFARSVKPADSVVVSIAALVYVRFARMSQTRSVSKVAANGLP